VPAFILQRAHIAAGWLDSGSRKTADRQIFPFYFSAGAPPIFVAVGMGVSSKQSRPPAFLKQHRSLGGKGSTVWENTGLSSFLDELVG
jgi:hypothetical protein